MNNTITITKEEYEELKIYKAEAKERTSFRLQKGTNYEKYKYLLGLYEYAKDMYPDLLGSIEDLYKEQI